MNYLSFIKICPDILLPSFCDPIFLLPFCNPLWIFTSGHQRDWEKVGRKNGQSYEICSCPSKDTVHLEILSLKKKILLILAFPDKNSKTSSFTLLYPSILCSVRHTCCIVTYSVSDPDPHVFAQHCYPNCSISFLLFRLQESGLGLGSQNILSKKPWTKKYAGIIFIRGKGKICFFLC